MRIVPQVIPRGAFGGGGGGTPIELPDNVASTDYACVELLLGEAPLSGIPSPLDKHVYLNGIPIVSKDGTANFTDVHIKYKLTEEPDGNTTIVPNLHSPSEVHVINAKVLNGTHTNGGDQIYDSANCVQWGLSNPETNWLHVTLHFPRLEKITLTGDTVNEEVDYIIQVKANGGPWLFVHPNGLRSFDYYIFKTGAKSAGGFKQSFPISGLLAEEAPYLVRVCRWTGDSASDRIMNEVWVDSYTEVVALNPVYPGSAILQVLYDARTFESPPEISVELLGLQCPYPTNYSIVQDSEARIIARVYDGVWDGTFTGPNFTDNPAWIFRRIALHKRWGLGDYLKASNLDDASLYDLAVYCDELVPGPDGQEPRFTFNGVFDQRVEAFTLLNNLASVFHGMLHYSNARLLVNADRPQDVTHLFSPSNVIDGKFQYEGTSHRARRSVVHVAWNDPENDYKQTVEAIQDRDLIARYGYVLDEVVAVGCTSQGQAQRVGRYILESEKLTQSVTFKPSLDAGFVLPGDVILTADPLRIGTRAGGVVVAATTDTITVDSPVKGLDITNRMSFFVTKSNGNVHSTFVAVHSASQTVFTLHDPIDADQVPIVGAQWAITPAAQWRVMGIRESDTPNTYEVTAAQYSVGKFAAIERQVDNNFDDQYSLLNPKKQDPVTRLRAHERLYTEKGLIKNQVQVTWDEPPGAHRYQFSYSRNGGPFVGGTVLELPHVEFLDLHPGDYVFRVIAVNAFKRKSTAVDLVQTILGKTAPPPDVLTLSVVTQSDGTRQVNWTLNEPVDFAGVRVRYSSDLAATWANMFALHSGLWTASPVEFNALSPGEYRFGIIAVDTSGNESVNPLFITANIGNPRSANVIGSYDGVSDGWSTDLSHVRDGDALTGIPVDTALPATSWDTLPPTWDEWDIWQGGESGPITWDGLAPTWDALDVTWDGLTSESGGVTSIRENWLDLPPNWSEWVSWTSRYDETVIIETRVIDLNAKATGFIFADLRGSYDSYLLEWKQSDDGVSYTAWSANFADPVSGRYVVARATVTRTGRIPVIRKFLVTIHGSSKFRSLAQLDTTTLSGGYRLATGDIRLPVAGTFATVDGVSVSFVGSAYQGYRYTITDYSSVLGPRIAVYDASGTPADAVISAFITGT
jgi:predicted phage tail protein